MAKVSINSQFCIQSWAYTIEPILLIIDFWLCWQTIQKAIFALTPLLHYPLDFFLTVCEPGKNSKGSKNFKDLKMNKETERPQFLSKKGAAPQKPLLTSLPVEQKPFRPNPVTNYHAPSNPSPQSTRELTNPTSIQINNAVSSMTRNGFHDFNFPGIRLPPEITITKVDPTKAKFKTPQRVSTPSGLRLYAN